MALIDSAVNGLAGALVAGGVSVVLFWLTGRGRRARLEEAWRSQAAELDRRLSTQYQGQIDWLREQLKNCNAETRRLNNQLARERGGGWDE